MLANRRGTERQRERESWLSERTQSLRANECERQTDRQMAGRIALLDKKTE